MPSLMATIGLNATPYRDGLNNCVGMANQAGAKIGKGMAGAFAQQAAGLLSVAAVTAVIKKTVDYADKVGDLSKRLGISTDAVQVWDYAVRTSGSSVEAFTSFLEKLAVTRAKALAGDAAATAGLKKFGIEIASLRTDRLDETAAKISDVFKAGGDPQKLIGALREVGGRSAGELIPTLTGGIREAQAEAQKLGLIIDNETIAKLKDVADQATTMGIQAIAFLAPIISEAMEGLQVIIDQTKAEFAGFSALFSNGFIDAFKHPGEALKRGAAEYQRVMDEALERDKAQKRKRSAEDNAKFTGGADDAAAVEKADKILSLRKQLYDLQQENDLKGLSKQKQLLELEERRAKLLLEMQGAKSEEAQLNAAIGIEKIDAQRRSLAESANKPDKQKRGELSLNANQQIGAYSSLNSSNLQNKLVSASEKSEVHLRRLVELANVRPSQSTKGIF